jgi:hypothetical protein
MSPPEFLASQTVPTMTANQKVLAISAAAAGAHCLIALVTNSFRIFFGVFGPFCVTGMLEIFFDYANHAVNGQVPYRDYLIEYPILGFLVFLIPRLFASEFAAYRIAFGMQLLLFNAVAVYLVARHVWKAEGVERVASRLAWYTAFFASLCPLLMGPYDLAPMAVAFAAAHLWFGGHSALGGATAAVGFLMKIFPGAVAAPALVWELTRFRESRARGILTFLASVAAGMCFWLWLGGTRVASAFLYHVERGLEIESLYAGILMLFSKATGERVTWVYNHGALHITPEWGDRLGRLALPLQLAAILLVMWQYRRSGMKDGVRYAGASVLAFMVTAKVLSPQFLIWMFPFMSVLGGETGRRARRTFLLACVATTIIYPLFALRLILEYNSLGAILLLNYRNALLVWLLFLLVFGSDEEHARTSRGPGSSAGACG